MASAAPSGAGGGGHDGSPADFARQVASLAGAAASAHTVGDRGGKLRRPGRAAAARASNRAVTENRLRVAANTRDSAAVRQLLEDGVDPCAHDDHKRAAIHFAVTKGDHDVLRLLLDFQADPNQRDFKGNTPLHLAACTNHLSIVTALLDSGADFAARDGAGRTPLHYAESHLRLLACMRRRADQADVLKSKVAEVAELLSAYLRRSGGPGAEELSELTGRLSVAGTADEVGDVAELLRGFTSLTLQQQAELAGGAGGAGGSGT